MDDNDEEEGEEEEPGPLFPEDDDEEGAGGGGGVAAEQQHARCVVHVDLNAFYYQCEALMDPSLRGKPVGVQQVRGWID